MKSKFLLAIVLLLIAAGVLMVWYAYAIFQNGRGLGFILIGVGISLLVAMGLYKIAVNIMYDDTRKRFFKWCYIVATSPVVLLYLWGIVNPAVRTAPTLLYYLVGAPFLFAVIFLPVTMPPVVSAHLAYKIISRRKTLVTMEQKGSAKGEEK